MELLDLNMRQSNETSTVEKYDGYYVKNREAVLTNSKILSEAVSASIQNEDHSFTMVVGGDSSMSIGSISGYKNVYADGHIMWMAAHLDVHSPLTSTTGDMHGMGLGALTQMTSSFQHATLEPSDLAYFGIREWKTVGSRFLENEHVLNFEAKDCTIEALPDQQAKIEEYFGKRGDVYHQWLSFDIDSIDPELFFCTGSRSPNGLTIEYLEKYFEMFLPHCQGMDIAEVNWAHAETSKVQDKDQATFRRLIEKIIDVTITNDN